MKPEPCKGDTPQSVCWKSATVKQEWSRHRDAYGASPGDETSCASTIGRIAHIDYLEANR
jgi:hypothetical protein